MRAHRSRVLLALGGALLALAFGWFALRGGGPAPGAAGSRGGDAADAASVEPEAELAGAGIAAVDVDEGRTLPPGSDAVVGELGTLLVRVVEAERPAPGVEVAAHGLGWGRTAWTDEDGVARFELPAARWEITIDPERAGIGRVVIPAPEGRSTAELEIVAGEEHELDLEVYRGATLEVTVVGAEDTWPVCRVARRDGEQWKPVVMSTTGRRGRASAIALLPGTYRVRPPAFRQISFEPVELELELGQAEQLRLIAVRRPRTQIPVVVRAGAGEERLPVRVQYGVSATRLDGAVDEGAPETDDVGGGMRRSGGVTGLDGMIAERLEPGSYDVVVRVPVVAPPNVQVLSVDPAREWRFRVEIGADGSADPAELELELELVGELAELEITIPGAQAGYAEELHLGLTLREGEAARHPLWVDTERSGGHVLLDLGLLKSREVSVVRGRPGAEHVVEVRELSAGAAAWSVVRNW